MLVTFFIDEIDDSQMNIKKQQFQQRKDAVKAAKEAKEKAEKEAAAAKAAQAKAQGTGVLCKLFSWSDGEQLSTACIYYVVG